MSASRPRWNLRAVIYSVLATVTIFPAVARAQSAYYVRPGGAGRTGTSRADAFGAIEQARDAIRARSDRSITGDITINILPGTYTLADTLLFGTRDGGRNGHRVVYRAADPAQPTVISGGTRIKGPWVRGSHNIWSASVKPGIFTQLYVNGRRATPAREPNSGWRMLKQWEDRFGSKSIRLRGHDNLKKDWQRPTQIEFLVKYHWAIARLHLGYWDTYDGDNVFFPPAETDSKIWTAIAPRENGQRYRLENALEFVDEPGEWYLDRAAWRLYYLPRPGEDPNRDNVVSPRLDHLLIVRGGDPKHPVSNLEFRGLRFENANWLYKNGTGAYVGAQAWLTWDEWQAGPGAVELENTRDVVFAANVFRNLGGVGLKLVRGTYRTLVGRNTFLDIGDTAVLIYTGPIAPGKDGLSEETLCREDVISDNVVNRYGVWNLAAAGISLVMGQRCVIEHNEVSDGGYAGITVGYFTQHDSPSRQNVVRANHIFRVMREVDDGGAIYVFNTHFDHYDKNERLEVDRNFIHDVHRGADTDCNPIAGIYLDEGTQGVSIRDNVVRDVDNWLHLNTGGGPVRETLPERQTIAGNTDENASVELSAGPRGVRPSLAPNLVKPKPVFAPSRLMYRLGSDTPGKPLEIEYHGGLTPRSGAFALNGQDQWLSLPAIDPGNRYTIAMWLYIPIGTTGDQTLVAGPNFRLTAHADGDRVSAVESWNRVGANEGGQDIYTDRSFPGRCPTGKWAHLAWVVDQYQGANRLYLDGNDVTKTDIRSGRPWSPGFDSSLRITIGARPDGAHPFTGKLSDIRIYGSWLRQRDIEALAAQRP